MKKILSFIVELVFWLQIFITPVAIGGVVALFIYVRNERLLWLSMIIAAIAVVIGIVYAERVRRKHGTSRYVSKILATPDIWPDEYPGETKVRKMEQQIKKDNM